MLEIIANISKFIHLNMILIVLDEEQRKIILCKGKSLIQIVSQLNDYPNQRPTPNIVAYRGPIPIQRMEPGPLSEPHAMKSLDTLRLC